MTKPALKREGKSFIGRFARGGSDEGRGFPLTPTGKASLRGVRSGRMPGEGAPLNPAAEPPGQGE